MALISIVYRLSNRRVVSSRVFGLEEPNQRLSSRLVVFSLFSTASSSDLTHDGSAICCGWWPTIGPPDQVLALEPACIWKISEKKRKKKRSFSFKLYARLLLSEFLVTSWCPTARRYVGTVLKFVVQQKF
ncbi:hypothetical protein AVEN_43309-1 [Araneus ventricosus]|uniref:Uncharacterized protein n=1 Tax=Araneus ventricosus TaxID=182803 RepID=A0A4Y2GWW1_ARAVE|nr:hypothetical protein AVEN_43309-1 [Araneus ventricosus]